MTFRPQPKSSRTQRQDRKRRQLLDKRRLREWSIAVRERDGGRCQVCGSTSGVQAHHLISRRYAATRYDVSNGFSACQACHTRIHAGQIQIERRDAA